MGTAKQLPTGFSRTHLDDGTHLTARTQPPRHHGAQLTPGKRWLCTGSVMRGPGRENSPWFKPQRGRLTVHRGPGSFQQGSHRARASQQ
ncbi:MAG: hypothetical protein QOH19_2326 [Actinomycetota bacterium]|jgi:hypothetical protein|nr:hypothetical protein [Actinomycetota bacterium]